MSPYTGPERRRAPSTWGDDVIHQARVFDSLLSATADFNYIFDREGRFSYINRALLNLLGLTLEQALGKNFHDLNYPKELATKLQAQIEQVFTTGKPVKDETVYINYENKYGYYEYIFVPIFDGEKNVEAVAGSTRDVTAYKNALDAQAESERRLAELNHKLESVVVERTSALAQSTAQLAVSLKEKEVLLREVHHRVKNNLQVIYSLLRMQSRGVDEPAAVSVLTDSQNRIRSMAMIHELLYLSDDLRGVNFRTYLNKLIIQLFGVYGIDEKKVTYRLDADSIAVDLDQAIPCGLITTELVSNIFKHAFRDRETGHLLVSFHRIGSQARLVVEDNGVGLPQELEWKNSTSLGFTIIQSLGRQLEGQCDFKARPGGGTQFSLEFPLHGV